MNKIELGLYIDNFVKLNPKKNIRPNIEKFEQNSFFVIQNCFKENKKSKLVGKKWIEILLSSKEIFEYNKRIRDDFPYCKQKKLIKILLDDLFYLFKSNIPNVLIEDTKQYFNDELKNNLIKIRKFLNDKEWSIYFFELQKIMQKQIIKFLSWNKTTFEYESYNKVLRKVLIKIMNENFVEEYLKIIQNINLYRNTLSKINTKMLYLNKSLLKEWKILSDFEKTSVCWKLYFELLSFINLQNLILNKNSL